MSDSRSLHKAVAESVRAIRPSGIRHFFDIVSKMEDTISLGVGEPGFATPWHIRDMAIYGLERNATSYTSNLGMEELRNHISLYLRKTFDLSYDPGSEILVTTGVSEGFDLAVRALVNPGDEMIYHEPSYVSYSPVIQLSHGLPVVIETRSEDHFKLSAERISEKISPRTKAIILNFPNNPTGAVLGLSELEEIAALARQHDLLVISDEIYAELTYSGRHVSIASLQGMKERTIFLHGLSKAWAMTGFRIGYACGPSDLIAAMTKIHQYTMLCAPTLSQIAASEAMRKAEADVEEMRARFRRNRNFIRSAFSEMGLPCSEPAGAFYAFPSIRELGLSSEEFALRLLEEERVAVVPGPAFGPCAEGYIRCSFATSLESIKTAMERLERFVRRRQDRS